MKGNTIRTHLIDDDGVLLVYRFPVGEKAGTEIHAYFQPHNGRMKAHVRLVNIGKDGTVGFTGKGVAVDPADLDHLLKAAAFLTAEKQALGV